MQTTYFLFVLTIAILGVVVIINQKGVNNPLKQIEISAQVQQKDEDLNIIPLLNITVSTEYKDNFQYYPFQFITQLHKLTTFNALPSIEYHDAIYLWEIDGSLYTGKQVEHTFNSFGTKSITLKMIYNNDNSEAIGYFTVMARYVRREVRSLTNEDREALLSAMETIFYTDTETGKATYGNLYRGIDYFVSVHLHGSAEKNCDHWHDDAGIVTHHMALTLEFENALRVVDPSVTLPYWDYTLDQYIYGVEWEDSVIFSDNWFGAASPDNDDHIITEGRWAYLPIYKNTMGYSMQNPWGLLRSPWNTNPITYVTRYDKVLNQRPYKHLPSCRQFESAFESDWIGEINAYLNGELHGPVHIMIGGHDNKFNDNRNLNKYIGNSISSILLISKNLWRLGYLRCPASCDDRTSNDDCRCSCPDSLRRGMTAKQLLSQSGQLPYMFWNSNGLIEWNYTQNTYHAINMSKEEEEVTFESILDSLCSIGYPGEMFTSASPADPTFWLIHPTAERFLQYRRFSSYYGNNTMNETWGYSHSGGSPSDFNKVCKWDDVGEEEFPICVSGSCYGHGNDDLLPQTHLIPDHTEQFTNKQFYDFLDPRSEVLPYVYDNFQWNHCTEQDITFDF